MAAVTHRNATADTSNVTSYPSGSFTPALNELLVVFVIAAATVAAGSMTDSQSLGFTKITSGVFNTGADTMYLFIANNLAAASAMTVTFDCTGDAATGAIILVAGVSGMSRKGSAAAKQSAKQENQAGGNTPSVVFGSLPTTGNPILVALANGANPATVTPPSGYTEQADTGFATPNRGGEYASLDSFSGVSGTVTWGSTYGTGQGAALGVELDTSAPQTLQTLTASQGQGAAVARVAAKVLVT